MTIKHRQRHRWFTISSIFLITGILFWNSYTLLAQSHSTESGIDIVILVDNSQSMTSGNEDEDEEPADGEKLRIRMSRFLIQFLRDIGDTNTRVGVITFAGQPSERIPLTFLDELQNGDFTAVEGENEGNETDFVNALASAAQMLNNNSLEDDNRQKYIWMFSDGKLNEFNTAKYFGQPGYVTKIKETIQGLPEYTQIWLFAFHNGTTDKRENIQIWQDEILNNPENYITVTEHTLDEIYTGILPTVIADNVIQDYTILTITDGDTLSETVNPYRRWTEFLIYADGPFTPTFTVNSNETITPTKPDYFFHAPSEGEWAITFQTNETTTIFYRQDSEKPDMVVEFAAPVIQAAERPLQIEAIIKIDGNPVTPSTDFTITAELQLPDGSIKRFPLEPEQETGVFKREIPAGEVVPINYPLQISAKIVDLEAFTTLTVARKSTPFIENLVITPNSFTEGDTLQLTANSFIEGDPLQLTAKVQNFNNLVTQNVLIVIENAQGITVTTATEALNNGLLDVIVPHHALNTGEYILKVMIPNENVVGGLTAKGASRPFSIKPFIPPPTPTPLPSPPHITDHPQTVREALVTVSAVIIIAVIMLIILLRRIRSLENRFQQSEFQKQKIQQELTRTQSHTQGLDEELTRTQTRTQGLEEELTRTQSQTRELDTKVHQLESTGRDIEDLHTRAINALDNGDDRMGKELLAQALDISEQRAMPYQLVNLTYNTLDLMVKHEHNLQKQCEIISECSAKESVVTLNSLAQLLLKRWAQQPNLLIPETYAILYTRGKSELFVMLQGLGIPLGLDNSSFG